MRDYTPVELPEQPFQEIEEEQNFSPVEEEEIVEPKKKRKLSQKQLDALAKGRARVAENRAKKREQLQSKKKVQPVKQKEAEKVVEKKVKFVEEKYTKRTIKGKKEKEIYEKLKAQEAQQIRDYKKIEKFIELREKFLGDCDTIEDFEELSAHLDTITEDDILNDELLIKKLNKMLVNYK